MNHIQNGISRLKNREKKLIFVVCRNNMDIWGIVMAQNTDFILELLQENGMVTEEQVSEGWKKVAEQDGQINIIDALKQLKYVDEFEMISMLAQQYGLEVLDLSTYRIPPEVIETVPREIVQQYKIVPVMKHDDVLTIAMSDPTDMATLDSIRFLMKCDVDAVILQ